MRVEKLVRLILVLMAAGRAPALAVENLILDPALLCERLLEFTGNPPWNLPDGYVLEGHFILKATGEELNYRARYARSSDRWAADFSQENQSRNVRYVQSGGKAWVASPEITTDASATSLPYMARYDFLLLYRELLRILQQAKSDPRFAVGNVSNEIYVLGTLQNGWEAVFTFSAVEYFPRKVHITITGEPACAWMLAFAKPDGSGILAGAPAPATEFEVWFSDPADGGGYRYARRMDFAERGNVLGTFFVENSSSLAASEDLFERPPDFPWLQFATFVPGAQSRIASLYLDPSEMPAFRARLKLQPWASWNNRSRIVAYWAILVSCIGPLFPPSVPFQWIFWGVIVSFLVFILLLLRRRTRLRRKFSWSLLAAAFLVCCFILIAAIASLQLGKSRDRSLMALHCGLRYAATGNSFYAKRAASFLPRSAHAAPPAPSLEDLGHSCQAFSLAYDLIRARLPHERRLEIETGLFHYAKPLFGASYGWISNTDSGAVLAAGLGMAGLAIGYEPFVTSARSILDRILSEQLIDGLHRSGPGQGCMALDSAANLFYGLKLTKRVDYFAQDPFRKYVRASLQLLSPVGTLPLFEDTNLDQPADLSMFFLKAANQMPEEEGRQCVAAHNLYWALGQHRAQGFMRIILPILQPLMTYFKNPYVLIEYTRALAPSPLRASSTVLGKGQYAVLRTGSDPDSMYLALNMPQQKSSTAPRGILAFDLYAYRSLLLHGPGFPGKDDPNRQDTHQTAAYNSITLNNESQQGNQCTGIETSLLNQPVFDYVRASADKTYDHGQVQRDIVMVRPERNHSAYFFLLDNVSVSDPNTTVQWHLHGSGALATGIDLVSLWTNAPFSPPRWRFDPVKLEAAHPLSFSGTLTSKSGMFYSQISFLNRESKASVVEWTGSRRFCTVLFPYKSGTAPQIETLGKDLGRVNGTDWIVLGTPENPVTAGPVVHASEFVILRERPGLFPAFLMVSGLEFHFKACSLFSTKPVTVSLKGLNGAFLSSRPNTQVEIHAPEIRAGDAFVLDGRHISAAEPGTLVFTLSNAGEHTIRRAS